MFNENSMYWILGVSIVGLFIIFAGFLASRNLPARQKKLKIQKFAGVALALMVFSLPLFKPIFSSHSRVEYLDELKAENLNSIEDIVKFDKEQTRNIERLKTEVTNLRTQLDQANNYYGVAIQYFSSILGAACLVFVFGKKKEEKNFEENQTDQI